MAEDTKLTRLNFHYEESGKIIVDKRCGLKITLGHMSGLRHNFTQYLNAHDGFTISIQAQGRAQEELDNDCNALSEEARINGIEILVTKSDLPFDNRWFIVGEIGAMIADAKQDKIRCPFSSFLYDEILEFIG